MATLNLTIKTNKDVNRFKVSDQPQENLNRIINFVSGVAIGAQSGVIDIQSSSSDPAAASATATLTYASLVNNTDTVVLFGVTLTCVTGTPTSVQFKKETDATVTAANLAAAINNHATLAKYVAASSALGVVTITLKQKGAVGNFVKDITSAGSGIALVQFAGGAGGVENSAVTISR